MILDQYQDIFIHNEWYDKYVELIESNRDQKPIKFETQRHHIIPRAYFKHENIPVDDSEDNLIVLTHYCHIMAHYYLSKCVSCDYLIYSNQYALFYMLNTRNLPDDEKEMLKISIEYSEVKKDFLIRQGKLHIGKKPWNYGKQMPDYIKEILRQANLGKKATEETKRKMSSSSIGKNSGGRYVHKGNEVRHIKEENLQEYLSSGWILGNPNAKVAAYKSQARNRKTIHKDDVEKRVFECDLEKYLNDGWELGRNLLTTSKISQKKVGQTSWNKGKSLSEEHRKKLSENHFDFKGTVFVNKEGKIKRIEKEQLQYYLSIGYKKGMK